MTIQHDQFTIESWNHNACEDKSYHMVWGPFPISKWRTEEITSNLRKSDPNVKFLKYKHAELKPDRTKKIRR